MDHDALQTCALCHRTLSSETDTIDLDSITICGDCKFLLLEENGTSTPSQHVPRTNPRIRRTTPSGSRRWRRVVYDTESDDLDSLNGDGDIVSYGTYDDGDDDYDDDVSVDARGFLGGDSDTDIDPMHAGLNQWSSDDEREEVEDGENGDNTLGSLIARVHLQRTMVYNEQSRETEGGIRERISETRLAPFGNMDNDQEPYVGNSGDYLDARSFEELLERLAETDNSRRGAPPAAQSFANNLDCLVVTDTDCNGLVCAICQELLTVGTAVNHLPCSHDYHPSCIKPWLSLHNTCPLCRFEFPTDDVDYEDRKESGYGDRGLEVQEVQQELEDNIEEDGGQEILNSECVEGTGGRRWWFVAAPVVSLVGIGLALWLGNPGAIKSSGSRGDRSRRWWGLF